MKRQTWVTAALTALAITSLAGSCVAQGQGGQGDQGGQGRGQRGQGRGGRRGGGRGLMGLVSMKEVQTELKMQQAQIDLVEGLRNTQRQNRGNGQDFRSMSEEERAKAFAQRRAEEEKSLSQVLDQKQMHRLKELDIQQQGPQALTRSSVQDALKLSADQKARIKAVSDEERTTMRSLFQRGGDNNGQRPSQEEMQARFQKMREMRTSTGNKLTAVLTEGQKKQFETMKGAPFTFPQRQFGGGRRNRGGQPSTT